MQVSCTATSVASTAGIIATVICKIRKYYFIEHTGLNDDDKHRRKLGEKAKWRVIQIVYLLIFPDYYLFIPLQTAGKYISFAIY